MKILIKRKLDQILAKGSGEQLGWLCAVIFLVIAVAILITNFFFADDNITWEDVIAIFIDSGYSLESGTHYWFRLGLAIISTFIFSALLISVFTNIFDNIGQSVRDGGRRYKLKGHVLVIGKDTNIISALKVKGETVVVLCEENPNLGKEIFYYNGSQISRDDILAARPYDADSIYIIGNKTSPNHDAMNLRTLEILKSVVPASNHKIHCYLSIHELSIKEVLHFLKNASETSECESGLLVDIVDEFEYQVEQLLVDTDFLPAIKYGEEKYAHFIIFGSGRAAISTAQELAHICHYPSYNTHGYRTIITMIGPDMEECYRYMLSAHPILFDMSHHSFISEKSPRVEHCPENGNDFLDIQWEFVEGKENSLISRTILTDIANQKNSQMRILICMEDEQKTIECALHLPKKSYETSKIALYINDYSDIVNLATSTGMYGDITIFGLANENISDPLMENRHKRGQRVNFIYNKAYSDTPAESESQAWYSISEADKCSSIYCASALPLRCRCYDLSQERRPVYEAEHRRWMMSALLMGYKPGKVKDKKRFIHPDIVPYESLSDEEKGKDQLLIDSINYILE